MKPGNMKITFPVGEILNPQRFGGFPISQLDVLRPSIIPGFNLTVDVDVEFDLVVVLQVHLALLVAHHRNVIANRPHMDLACAIVDPVCGSHAVLAGLGQGFALIVVSRLAVVVEEDHGRLGEPLLDAGVPTIRRGVVVDGMDPDRSRKGIDQDEADLFLLDIFSDFGLSCCHAKAGV